MSNNDAPQSAEGEAAPAKRYLCGCGHADSAHTSTGCKFSSCRCTRPTPACPTCHGWKRGITVDGEFFDTCPTCNGTGYLDDPRGHYEGGVTPKFTHDCPQCGGRGIIEPEKPRSADSTDAPKVEPSGDDTLTEILERLYEQGYNAGDGFKVNQHSSIGDARTQLLQYIEGEVDSELDLLTDPDILKLIRNKGVKHWVQLRKSELAEQRQRLRGSE